MTRPRKYDPSQIATAVARYADGVSSVILGREIGCHPSLVRTWARQYGKAIGKPRGGQGGGKLSHEQRAECTRLALDGWSHTELGQHFGVSPQAVRRYDPRCTMRAPEPQHPGPRNQVRSERHVVICENFSSAEARRLSERGLPLTAIAAMLRAPYKQVAEAIGA